MPVFVGLHIGDERLYDLGRVFQRYSYSIVSLEHQHLTLLFIGDYKGVFLHNIVSLLKEVVLVIPSTLIPKGIVLIPPGKNTNVAVTVENDKRLLVARQLIIKKLTEHDIVIRDKYSFLPHVTIARRRKPLDSLNSKEVLLLLKRIEKLLPRFIVVRGVFLYETTREGYRRVLELKAKWV